jgi:hypothetical protein
MQLAFSKKHIVLPIVFLFVAKLTKKFNKAKNRNFLDCKVGQKRP